MNICPYCGRQFSDPPALSRVDDRTLCCPKCGTRQALEIAGFSEETIKIFLAYIYREDNHND